MKNIQYSLSSYRFPYLFLLSITFLFGNSNAKAQTNYTPSNYEVIFNVERQDINAGKMTMRLEKQNDTWLGTSSYKPSFIAKMLGLSKSIERTVFVNREDKFSIAEYSMQMGKDKKTVPFDFNNSTYNSGMPTPENAQTNQTILSTLSQDITQNKTQATYTIFNKEEFKQYAISYEYNQKITIQSENINTVKATLSKGNRTTVFWLAEKWNWAPVKFAKYRKEKTLLEGHFKSIKQ